MRIQNNINNDEKSGETCQDRNIKESLNGIRKLLRGEELTGGERLENLQPSLPSNLDNAAEKYAQKEYPDKPSCGQWGTGDYEPPVDMEYPREIAKDSFKTGVEWLAGQGVKAHCIESCNPVSENPNQRLHLITLLYEENESTPYVIVGDTVELIIRKK